MNTNERMQALALEQLYGLIEPQDAKELEAYLASPEGQPLKQQMAQWGTVLSTAAKTTFPEVQFAPPVATKITPTSTGVRAPRSMYRYALTAAICAAIAILAVPAGVQFSGWWSASQEVARQELARNKAKDEQATLEKEIASKAKAIVEERKRAQDELARLTTEHDQKLNEIQRKAADQEFSVSLMGPATIQPGAPNSWKMMVRNQKGKYAIPNRLEVVVKDQNDTELVHQSFEKPNEPPVLNLTTAFWNKVQPDTQLFMHVTAISTDNRKSTLMEKLPLARPVYVTQLTTDKPLYKPGEMVFYRSLTLDRGTFLPPEQDMLLVFKMTDPSGATKEIDRTNGRIFDGQKLITGPDRKPIRGIGAGQFALADAAPGGEYQLQVFEVEPATNKEKLLETRKFIVNNYDPDIFEKKLEFDGKTYGAGDLVQFKLTASRTEGGALKQAKATVVARVDNKEILNSQARLDNEGALRIRFELPKTLAKEEGTVSVTIQDGDSVETIVRPIPIIGTKLNIAFFPEGGELVAGLKSRVYFQARTPHGKPADLKGYLTDGKNRLAELKTLTDEELPGVNRGQGMFEFTPVAGLKYHVVLEKPSKIVPPSPEGFALPTVQASGVVLKSLDPINEVGKPIRLELQSTQDKVLHVGAYARGNLFQHVPVDVKANQPTAFELTGAASFGGVTRITVFEEIGKDDQLDLKPVAERLVYRQAAEKLALSVQPNKTGYTPAGKVELNLSTFDEKEKSVPAVVMVAVVNQSVITMADNKTDRLLPTHFYLAGDVKNPAELEHADFLLTDHPKAGVALDLLLGTQGWRRFAEQLTAPATKDREAVDQLLISTGQKATEAVEVTKLQFEAVNAKYVPQLEASALAVADAQSAYEEFANTQLPILRTTFNEKRAELERLNNSHTNALSVLHGYETRAESFRTLAMPILFCLMLTVGIIMGIRAMLASTQRRLIISGSMASFAIAGILVAGLIMTRPTEETTEAFFAKANDNKAVATAEGIEIEDQAAWHFNADNDRLNLMEGGGFGGGGGELEKLAEGKGFLRNEDLFQGRGGVRREKMLKAGGGNFPAPGMMAPRAPGGPPVFDGVPEMAVPQANAVDPGQKFDAKLALGLQKKNAEDKAKEARFGANRKQLMDQLMRQRRPNDGPNRGVGFGRGMPGAGVPFEAGMAAEELKEQAQNGMVPASPAYIREFAHTRDVTLGETRSDFAETVFWHPALVMPENGQATVSFQLSDSIARYQVLVAGHTLNGRIGAMTQTIEARKPFSVEPKLPLEVTNTDQLVIPIRVVNDSDSSRSISYQATANGLKFGNEVTVKDQMNLGPNGKGRKLLHATPSILQGPAGVYVEGNSEPAAMPDSSQRLLKVVPDGFPYAVAYSDVLEKTAHGKLFLPKDVVPGTLQARLEVYPNTMNDLVKGLEGLLREPHGCFEQTSTVNYPNVMILNYLKDTNQTNPELSQKAKGLLEKGYQRLVGYECPNTPTSAKLGFEWFGNKDRAHEALTAYGLLQFKDMAKVFDVDPTMIKRTQEFLMSRRDGKGGFLRDSQALDSFGRAPEYTTNAYIVWSLVESDPDNKEKLDLAKEIAALKEQATDAKSVGYSDSYFLAIVANILVQRDDRETALKILDRLAGKDLFKEGKVTGAKTSITNSGCVALDIETTSIAILGWLRSNEPRFAKTSKDATQWLTAQKGAFGGYGSTQSTILALKALITHAKKNARPAESGTMDVKIDGKLVATRKYSKDDLEVIAIEIPDYAKILTPGQEHTIELVKTVDEAGKEPEAGYPFTFACEATVLTPVSSKETALQLTTSLSRAAAVEGETVPVQVKLQNLQNKGQGMSMAIIGIPAGMKVPTDMKQLTDLRERNKISYFEIKGRELILYWRQMEPNQTVEVSVDLVCDLPGKYRGPASRAYLYYTNEYKHWVAPLSIEIAPADEEVVAGK
ncbi:MAG: alpha-2-macroglobulin family protein [Zavarzinella sp.]